MSISPFLFLMVRDCRFHQPDLLAIHACDLGFTGLAQGFCIDEQNFPPTLPSFLRVDMERGLVGRLNTSLNRSFEITGPPTRGFCPGPMHPAVGLLPLLAVGGPGAG